MAFKFEGEADFFRGSLTNSLGNSVYAYTWACYSGVFHDKVLKQLVDPDVKWYDVYWSDALSLVTKNRKSTEKTLKLLSSTGIFRNTEVTLIGVEDIPEDVMEGFHPKTTWGYDFTKEANYWIRLRHDIDKCSGEEMFLVGSIVRTFALYPEVIQRFLKLVSKYGKKYEVSHLFLIAHSLTWTKEEVNLYGHRLVQSSFSVLTGKTFTNFLEDLDADPDTFTPIRKSNHYLKKRVDVYFTESIGIKDKYDRVSSMISRWGGTLFSRNIIKTYFDKEYFLKVASKNKTKLSLKTIL